jgi:hypothetical protein
MKLARKPHPEAEVSSELANRYSLLLFLRERMNEII